MGIYNDLGFRDGMTGKEIAVLLAGQRSTWSLKLQSQDSAAQEEAQTKLLGIQLLTEAVTKISGDFQRPSLAMKTLCAAIDNELPNYREYEENMIRVCNEEANIANLNGILAYLNETGRDEVIDEWLMYLAEQGHTSAYQSYADRLLLRKDDALKAKEWYEKAMNAGRLDAEGYANYAETALADGSVQQAIDALKKADEMGNLEGAYRLAQIYDLGEDVRRNDDEALRLYEEVEKLAKGDLKERAQAGRKRVSERIEARIEAERRRAEEYEKKFREAEAKAEAEYEAADEAKAAKLSAAAQGADAEKTAADAVIGADAKAEAAADENASVQDEAAKAAGETGAAEDSAKETAGNAEELKPEVEGTVSDAGAQSPSAAPDEVPAGFAEQAQKQDAAEAGTKESSTGGTETAQAAGISADASSSEVDDIVISTISAMLNEGLADSQSKVDGVPDSFVKPAAAAGEREDAKKRASKNGRDRKAAARQAARPDVTRERQEKRDQAAGTARGRSSGSKPQNGQDRTSVQRDTTGRKTQHTPQEIRSGKKRSSSSSSGGSRNSGSPVGLIIIVIILLIILIFLMLRMLRGNSGTARQDGQDEVVAGTSLENSQEGAEQEANSVEAGQESGQQAGEEVSSSAEQGSEAPAESESGQDVVEASGERSALDMLRGFDEHQVITSEFNESAYTVAVPSGYDATSELVSSSGRVYGVEYLFDRTLQKSWQDGVSGDGIGERIHVTFPQDTYISAIGFWNGTQSSSEYFRQNNRIKDVHLKLTYAGETYETDLELKDMMGEQAIVFDAPVPIEDFLMEIRSVTKGDSWDDTALAEMTFYTQKN